jgi:hypothetical protein
MRRRGRFIALALLLCVGGCEHEDKDPAAPKPNAVEHALITHLPLKGGFYGSRRERRAIHRLEKRLERTVLAVGGEHDGDEFGGGEAVLYTYGPNADALLAALRQSLGSYQPLPGAYAIKRYGEVSDPNAREERVPLP